MNLMIQSIAFLAMISTVFAADNGGSAASTVPTSSQPSRYDVLAVQDSAVRKFPPVDKHTFVMFTPSDVQTKAFMSFPQEVDHKILGSKPLSKVQVLSRHIQQAIVADKSPNAPIIQLYSPFQPTQLMPGLSNSNIVKIISEYADPTAEEMKIFQELPMDQKVLQAHPRNVSLYILTHDPFVNLMQQEIWALFVSHTALDVKMGAADLIMNSSSNSLMGKNIFDWHEGLSQPTQDSLKPTYQALKNILSQSDLMLQAGIEFGINFRFESNLNFNFSQEIKNAVVLFRNMYTSFNSSYDYQIDYTMRQYQSDIRFSKDFEARFKPLSQVFSRLFPADKAEAAEQFLSLYSGAFRNMGKGIRKSEIELQKELFQKIVNICQIENIYTRLTDLFLRLASK